jgi:hypothetical protein
LYVWGREVLKEEGEVEKEGRLLEEGGDSREGEEEVARLRGREFAELLRDTFSMWMEERVRMTGGVPGDGEKEEEAEMEGLPKLSLLITLAICLELCTLYSRRLSNHFWTTEKYLFFLAEMPI